VREEADRYRGHPAAAAGQNGAKACKAERRSLLGAGVRFSPPRLGRIDLEPFGNTQSGAAMIAGNPVETTEGNSKQQNGVVIAENVLFIDSGTQLGEPEAPAEKW